ncbi:hypothetical protein [Sphaerisporangium sp. TRM90804]|uniref:hypothetical protein n=1 Tax=Sphaerisporangium sp. TRM90804 TaxID=3031113 RepID=UPI00244AB3CB|nr:hypothetical protein [Sphaerisporangium sp. TRM90804]MDH2427553.1 hypothetical protein [Sphaerisporangium sp. TRM90804]
MSKPPGGRHRDGVLPDQFVSRRFDQVKKAAAAQLDRMEPGWLILYGEWTREFVAFARWAAEPVRVASATVDELRGLMREAELGKMFRSVARRGAA